MESVCQSSVEALPRRFGLEQEAMPPLPFTGAERHATRFDGGSEVDVLREEAAAGCDLTEAQAAFLETEDADSWKRPSFPLRDGDGAPLPPAALQAPRESSYNLTIDSFAVARCPSY